MQLKDFYRDLYAVMKLRSSSPRTKELYCSTIRAFERFLGRSATLDDLSDLTVNRFLSYLRDRELSPYTINKERSNLLAMWNYAARKGYVDRWPDVPAQTEPEVIPMAWMEEEIRAIFAACDRIYGRFEGVPCNLWWKALLLVIWDTGERISAVRGIEWQHVDLKRSWLKVPAKLRKGKRSDKAFRLSAETVGLLREIKKVTARSIVFPWPYSETYLWLKYGKLLESAGVDAGPRSKFHRIRRTVASFYEAGGGDATELLGHSDRKVTRKHYLDPRVTGSQKPACEVLFRLEQHNGPAA
jgi:integrase